jgi:hypothetical protein
VPLPTTDERIDEEQARVARPFPAGMRARLLRSNGGDALVEGEHWTLYPVRDPAPKRSAQRSAGHIARETAALYDALGAFLPPGLVAIGENGAGDHLLLDPESRPIVWRHETATLSPADVDWAGVLPPLRRRSPRAEAVDRVAAGLAALTGGASHAVVIEAPGTGIYIQFATVGDAIVGESVGERNLSRLHAYHMGATMRSRLPELGWAAPTDPASDSGNWTRTWAAAAWDPRTVARLVVRTFAEVYGLEPWALAVSPTATS